MVIINGIKHKIIQLKEDIYYLGSSLLVSPWQCSHDLCAYFREKEFLILDIEEGLYYNAPTIDDIDNGWSIEDCDDSHSAPKGIVDLAERTIIKSIEEYENLIKLERL